MPRQAGIKVVNKFQRGLVTEATGLNFPEDAVTESLNVIFDPESIARRRKGINQEVSGVEKTDLAPQSESVRVEYVWKNAAGSYKYTFVCVQIGSRIIFYRATGDALSANEMASSITLSSFSTGSSSGEIAKEQCSFASGNNYLFVTHPLCEPFYIEYTPGAGTFTGHEITLQIRDFDGVEDDLDVDERPSSLSDEHEYNIKNQGWFKEVVKVRSGSGEIDTPPIDFFKAEMGVYPSNADVWYTYKRLRTDGSAIVFDPAYNANMDSVGNTAAPKGHYILDAFYLDRSGASDVTGLDVVSSGYERPSAVAFFAGRVWYAGTGHKKFGSNIYFSIIAESDEDYGKCYQSQDPTSEDVSDLLPSDGGIVKIPEVGTVYKMIPIQSSLLIFASNGVWAIAGSEGLGFRANDYSVRKISTVGAINRTSFADVEGFAVWWNADGIYSLATDNVGSFTVESLSDTTIKSYYDTIPIKSKQYSKGAYNSQTKVIQWLYRMDDTFWPLTGNDYNYYYDKILNFNLISKAFYIWDVINEINTIQGIVAVEADGTQVETVNVIEDGSDDVVDTVLDNVVVDVQVTEKRASVFKYFYDWVEVGPGGGFSFAEEYDSDYVDWNFNSFNGTFGSYFVTGMSLDGQAVNYAQANYAFIFCQEEAGSGVFVQGNYDWAYSPNTGKWSMPQQAYNDRRPSRSVRVAKLKIRGKGRSIQLYFYNDDAKPFNIIGWGLNVSANQVP